MRKTEKQRIQLSPRLLCKMIPGALTRAHQEFRWLEAINLLPGAILARAHFRRLRPPNQVR